MISGQFKSCPSSWSQSAPYGFSLNPDNNDTDRQSRLKAARSDPSTNPWACHELGQSVAANTDRQVSSLTQTSRQACLQHARLPAERLVQRTTVHWTLATRWPHLSVRLCTQRPVYQTKIYTHRSYTTYRFISAIRPLGNTCNKQAPLV